MGNFRKKLFKLSACKVYILDYCARCLCLTVEVQVCHPELILQHNSSAAAMRSGDSTFYIDASFLPFLQTKVGASESRGSFEEVLSSAANASSQDTPTNVLTDSSERPC